MIKGKKIVSLRFDTWGLFSEWKNSYYEILPTWIAQKERGKRKRNICFRIQTKFCPVCNMNLEEIDVSGVPDEDGVGKVYNICPDCGFWRCENTNTWCPPVYEIPFIKRFDYDSETPSISHLSHEIYNDQLKLYNMNPKKFELYVGSVLSDFFECEVRHVGQSGDDGTDLIALIGDKPLLIQVKRRGTPGRTEGIDVVKLIFASAFARGVSDGMIITSAKKFSKQAFQWIESPKLKEVGFNFTLADFNSLMSMIDAVLKKNDSQPWELHQTHNQRNMFNNLPVNDKGWEVIGISDGDIVLKTHGDKITIIAFEHFDLTKCYSATIDKESKPLICSELKFYHLKWIVEQYSTWEVFYDTKARTLINSIPAELWEKLNLRWLTKFPKKLFDIIN